MRKTWLRSTYPSGGKIGGGTAEGETGTVGGELGTARGETGTVGVDVPQVPRWSGVNDGLASANGSTSFCLIHPSVPGATAAASTVEPLAEQNRSFNQRSGVAVFSATICHTLSAGMGIAGFELGFELRGVETGAAETGSAGAADASGATDGSGAGNRVKLGVSAGVRPI